MNFWQQFPDKEKLESNSSSPDTIYDVNAHLHTPYSFCAFDSVNQATLLAREENVKVIGINDFFTTSGYREWAERCTENNAFPLFNIEFIGLSKDDQDNNIRINDPNNPGRIYISGKGMSYPFKLEEPYKSDLESVYSKSNLQVKAMCGVLNQYLKKLSIDINLSYTEILQKDTKGMIRERHLAKALRVKVFEKETDNDKRIQLLAKIFGGNPPKSDITSNAAIENEIRGKLLKAGGAAFISESPELFLPLEKVRELILNGGGIPTYPLLADSVNGGFTEFEEDREKLLANLKAKGFYAVEFIPNRNTMKVLEEYSKFFVDNGFIVTFGTEHNTPDLIPMRVKTVKNEELTDTLKEINFNGACIVAAHQYLKARYGNGFLDEKGVPVSNQHDEFIQLGRSIINYFVS